jgi:hypothetical protein
LETQRLKHNAPFERDGSSFSSEFSRLVDRTLCFVADMKEHVSAADTPLETHGSQGRKTPNRPMPTRKPDCPDFHLGTGS